MADATFQGGRLQDNLSLAMHDFGDGTVGTKGVQVDPDLSMAALASPFRGTVLIDDDFRHGAQGWTQLIDAYPVGFLSLDAHIAAHGSGYSLQLNTGDYANAGNPFGGCMAIKRMGRSKNFKHVYAKMLFASGSLQSPLAVGERSPRAVQLGIDNAKNDGDRRYFKCRWHNWQYISTTTNGKCQAGSTSTTIKLATSASSTNDAYNGLWAIITGGTGVYGEGRLISAYVGSTRVATVTSPWTTTPDATTTYIINSTTVGDTGQMQAGSTATTAVLRAAASATANAFRGQWIVITGGTGVVGQARRISAYDGTTKVATLIGSWTTVPDATTTYTVTAGTNAELTPTRVMRLEVYHEDLKAYVPVLNAEGGIDVYNLGWNENKRNLHEMEMLVDVENGVYEAIRFDGVGYGLWADIPNNSLKAYKAELTALPSFGNGLNMTVECLNRTEANEAASWVNLAHAKMVGFGS